jgi:hypothetical protein
MQGKQTIEMLDKEKCRCIFCQSRDRDITEFYMVQVKGDELGETPRMPSFASGRCNGVINVETDRFAKVICQKEGRKGKAEGGHNKECLKCPHGIREETKSIVCTAHGAKARKVQRVAEFDALKKCLNDTEGFIELDSCPSAKKVILEQLKQHARKTGWTIKGFSKKDTIVWLDMLIEFSKLAEERILSSGHGPDSHGTEEAVNEPGER